jgi:phenylacetate-CoA ligase
VLKQLQVVYERVPIPLQDVMTSGYGLLLHWQRYGYGSNAYANELKLHEQWSADRIHALEFDLLHQRSTLALQRVPAYSHLRDRLPALNRARTPDEILDLFPLLTKQEVRSNAEAFIPTGLNEPIVHGATSGTTGTPLKLFRTHEGIRRNFAFFRRLRRWRGLSHWSRTATMLGRPVVPKNQANPPFWRYSWLTRNLLLSPYHVGTATVDGYADAIFAFRPEQIVCIPSCMLPVAKAMLRRGMRLNTVKAIFTTAESLSQEDRSTFETVFGAPVADQYGASEWTIWVSQCEYGTYHVHPEYGYLEIVDDSGRRMVDGIGRAISTGFINDAMVLIRYDTGDRMEAARDSSTCQCRRNFRIVSRIEGRIEDSIVTPTGRAVSGTLVTLFRGLTGIVQAQVVQTSLAGIRVNIVPDETWSAETHRQVIEGLDRRLGGGMEIAVELVPSIPRTAAGKVRSVIGLKSAGGSANEPMVQ